MKIWIYVGNFFCLIAAILAGTSYWLYQGRAVEIAAYQPAVGVIVGSHVNTEGGRKMFAPIIRFESNDGESVEFKSRTFSRPPRFEIGDEIEIVYDPKDPARAMIDNFVVRYLTAIVIAIFAWAILILGLVVHFFRWRTRRHDRATGPGPDPD